MKGEYVRVGHVCGWLGGVEKVVGEVEGDEMRGRSLLQLYKVQLLWEKG
jgi:hypothetical protein